MPDSEQARAQEREARRIPQPVRDVGSPGELLRYALAAQLACVLNARPHLSQARIAQAAEMGASTRNAGAALSALLRGPKTLKQDSAVPTVKTLQRLDKAISSMTPPGEVAGLLSSMAVRLSKHQRDTSGLIAQMPAAWDRQLMGLSPTTEIGVLNQASALLSQFLYASKMDTSDQSVNDVLHQHRAKLDDLVTRLILIAVGPPTPFNIDAQILLGSLASYALNPMLDRLEQELRKGPLSFRVWRAITKLIKLSPENGPHTQQLQSWVRRLLLDADKLRTTSLYPGRSLDLELAITIPASWSTPDNDWVAQVLEARALNPDATIRERGTAAFGLWERALSHPDRDAETVKRALRPLIDEFKNPSARPDAANGLRWVATTLEYVITNDLRVCNDWPAVDEPKTDLTSTATRQSWIDHVHQAADELEYLGIPPHLLTGTQNLFTHALLQNAGVHRRQTLETLIAGGWIRPIARALGKVLEDEQNESWLRIRALFALGFLQNRDRGVEEDLTAACQHAYQNLAANDYAPSRAQITEMHAALFSVGDCFGATGAEDQAADIRENLAPLLWDLVTKDRTHHHTLHPVARALAYLLTVTAQPRIDDNKDMAEVLLEHLRNHPDEATKSLAEWALSFRFPEDGSVQPLFAAPRHAPHRRT